MILRFVPSGSFKFWGVCFLENRVILWVSINYPKPILKELFNLQLWSCTFFQHVTVLFHLYTFLKFLESFAYCVRLSASLRTGFHKMKIWFPSCSINIVWKDYSIFIFFKVVSCSWRCGYHRSKTTIIKWIILTSSPIFDWRFFEHPSLLRRVLKNRVFQSFHPSFSLSVFFPGIDSLFFSET